jgi:hypothetical protein
MLPQQELIISRGKSQLPGEELGNEFGAAERQLAAAQRRCVPHFGPPTLVHSLALVNC